MKLLIITQKMDCEDPVLGFFHHWVEKLAERFEKTTVICLQKGTVNLPPDIAVWSLGKEIKQSRLSYLLNFFRCIWVLRKSYDAVFVHMNPVYIVLGGMCWLLLGKKYYLWYNHSYGNFLTWLAAAMAHNVFYTSPFSYTARFKHGRRMPAGIDTELFSRNTGIIRQPRSILYLGRISPIKKVDVLIQAAELLNKRAGDFTLCIAGGAEKQFADYYNSITALAESPACSGRIRFMGEIPNYRAAEVYNGNEVLVNLSPSGLFDKTVLEAMACEALVIASSEAFREFLPLECLFAEGNAEDLAEKLHYLINLPQEAKQAYGNRFRQYIIERHDLTLLTKELSRALAGRGNKGQ
jgi:glycosyltransferase involved in cell wall biosynthesis